MRFSDDFYKGENIMRKSAVDIKRYFQIILLILAAGSIYPMLYMRTNFQTSITSVFGMSVEELSNLYMILGMMFIVGYIPSGWLADRFSPRILISFSLAATGVIGLYYAQIPSKENLKIVFFIGGVTTVFTFWSSLIKGIKLLAKKNEQARVFGFLDGGRGVVEAILGTVAVSLFAIIVKGQEGNMVLTKNALQTVIYMYTFLCIILGIFIFIFMDKETMPADGEPQVKIEKEKNTFFADLKKMIMIKEIWLVMAIIFCGYSVYWTVYYFSAYLQINHGATAVFAGYVSVVILWMRPIGGIGGGFLGDKLGKPIVLGLAMLIESVMLVAGGFLPGSFGIILLSGIVIIAALMGYAIRGLYWSILDDCEIPPSILGFAIGIISFIGYTPDIFIPFYSGKIFTAYKDGPMAYSLYFLVSAGFGVLGFLICLYFNYSVKNKNKIKQHS